MNEYNKRSGNTLQGGKIINALSRFGKYFNTTLLQIIVELKSQKKLLSLFFFLGIAIWGKASNGFERIMCGGLVDTTTIEVSTTDCENLQSICLPLSYATVSGYQVRDNGLPYTNGLAGCDADTSFFYNYGSLPTNENLVINWSVDANLFVGPVANLAAVIDQLNSWDDTGNWWLDEPSTSIRGGDPSKTYGNLELTVISSNTLYSLPVELNIVDLGTLLLLDTGYHELVLEDTDLACLDTVFITVQCLDCPNLLNDDAVYVQSEDCGGTTDFCFPLASSLTTQYSFWDNGSTMSWTGTDCNGSGTTVPLSDGMHELVIVNNDNLCSDTLWTQVACLTTSYETVSVPLGQVSTLCLATDELVGSPQPFMNLCPDESGEYAVLSADTDPSCLRVNGVEIGVETACLLLCDNLGLCDTTYWTINVVESMTNEGRLPRAEDDMAFTSAATPVVIDVLGNDSLNGGLDSFYLSSEAIGGVAELERDFNTLIYTPNVGYCGEDRINYTICNAEGCDEATVMIDIACPQAQVYNGFSPNGDGRNDYFVLSGAPGQPDNQLYVYNKWGNLVFERAGYQNDWDATWNGKDLPDGTYFYLYDDGNGQRLTGYVQIQR